MNVTEEMRRVVEKPRWTKHLERLRDDMEESIEQLRENGYDDEAQIKRFRLNYFRAVAEHTHKRKGRNTTQRLDWMANALYDKEFGDEDRNENTVR